MFVGMRGCKTLLNCSSKIAHISNISDVLLHNIPSSGVLMKIIGVEFFYD